MRRLIFVIFILIGIIAAEPIWEGRFNADGDANLRHGGSFMVLHIAGWQQLGSSGLPVLPAYPIYVELHGRYDIDSIDISVEHWETVLLSPEKIILPGAELVPRLPENRGVIPNVMPNPNIYSKDAFFPKQLRYTAGFDGEKTVLSILVSTRYNPMDGLLKIPRRGTISINGTSCVERSFSMDAVFTEQNCIIAPPELSVAAESLAALHESFAVPSVVILTDWISTSYDTAPQPPIPGYPDETVSFTMLYNRDLAQRIISFLRDDSEHPNLCSVTLLGDASQVPPSFYYYNGWGHNWDSFVPSDFFYSSPDYDWIPQFGVGRIPIQTEYNAIKYIQRLHRWHDAADEEKFGKILFAGGKPFGGTFFDDEHSMMHIAGEGVAVDADWHKLYVTRQSFGADSFAAYFGQDWGFICEMGHGSGYDIYFDDGTDWGVDEIAAASDRNFAPFLFVGVCLDGMFDQDIIPEIGDAVTFPEAMLMSAGGPIAVFAATRSSFGAAISLTDEGMVIVESEEYITEMGYRLALTLAARPLTVGDWLTGTITTYTTLNDMMDDSNIETLMEFIMHGDPALPLPPFPLMDAVVPPAVDMPTPAYMTFYDYIEMPAYHGDDITCTVAGASESFFSYFSGDDAEILHKSTGTSLDISPTVPGTYMISSDADDGAETRIHTVSSPGDIIVDGCIAEWAMFEHPVVAIDPDDFTEEWLEMTDLYAYADAYFLYIAFTVPYDDENSRYFQLALDYKSGGYTGEAGTDTDPCDIFVGFPEIYAVDAVISTYVGSWYGWTYSSVDIYEFWEAYWNWNSLSSIDGVAQMSNSCGYMEIAIPIDFFDDAEAISMMLYSCVDPEEVMGSYPAQDCVPSDDAAYHSLTEGVEYANILTNFVTIPLPASIGEKQTLPKNIALRISPNPFNSMCKIEFDGIDAADEAILQIIDISGHCVREIALKEQAGKIALDADGLHSGIYFAKIKSRNTCTAQKMFIIR